MNDGKEKISHYACKTHTARSEKDLFRICPSKLSKDELENLYFALLDSNVQQKKTINSQRDQIKVLNTKVHRMTAQKTVPACNKDCCSSSKAIINDQKASIADLKKANERLSERIKTLNMRLCSAKQFLKRSPQSNSYCTKCRTSASSFKNLSTSALYTKRSGSNLQAAATSSQFLDRDKVPNKMTQIASTQVDMSTRDGTCQQNKCRTTMDELKQKIVNLEEELDKTHKGYCERLSKLEAEVNSLHGENARVRAENTSSLEKLQDKEKESTVLLQKLRSSEAQCDNLNAQLIIEKGRVSELETQVKAGDISEQIARALEIHLKREISTGDIENRKSVAFRSNYELPIISKCSLEDSKMLLVPNNSLASDTVESREKFNMHSDDSGYTETNRIQVSDKKENKYEETPKFDKDISQHIAELQAQIDSIKHTMKQQNRRAANNAVIFEDPQLQEKSNESYKVADTSSSLSNDIFATRMKYLERSDQAPSTSRINDNVLVSTEDVTQFPKSGLTQQNLNSNIPLLIKENRMPNVQNTLHSRTLNDKIEIKYEGVNKVDNEIIIEESNDQKYKKNDINDVSPKLCVEKHFPDKEERSNFKTLDASPNGRSTLKKKIHYIDGDVDKQYSNDEKITDFENNDKFCNNYNCENKCGIVEESGRGFNNKMDETLDFNNEVVTKDVATDEEKSSSGQKSVGQSTFVIETKQNRETANKDTSVDTEEYQLDICENTARVCRCARAPRRERAVFRTCSGTLCFHAISTDKNKFRHCKCVYETRDTCVDVKANSTDKRKSGRTYSLARASPDNTDQEISSLTDLPREIDVPDRGMQSRSPGEERAATLSDSYAAADSASLSEGELPVSAGVKRLSLAEVEMKDKMTESTGQQSSIYKMEEALHSISEELARCRRLLQTHRQKTLYKDTSSMTEDNAIALRRSEGSSRMAGYVPKCIFTIHVSTVLLSDQAIIFSRDKYLSLTWRFYNQSPTMTRQLAARVMQFDFSTEYDVVITEHLLQYLKQEEMPIIILDSDNQDETFASCSLPLRDALLHTNRRVDMSLALFRQVSSPPPEEDTQNYMGLNEEVGVIDVWCMLRVEPDALPAINKAIAKPSSTNNQPTMMEQIFDDEQSIDYRFSHDMPWNDNKYISNQNRNNEADAEYEKKHERYREKSKFSEFSENIYDLLKNKKFGRRRSSQKSQESNSRRKSISTYPKVSVMRPPELNRMSSQNNEDHSQNLEITILWLAINEECTAMSDPKVKKLYIAYSFLGRSGVELETPISLMKPKNYMEKCYFNFKKIFTLNDCDLPLLGHLARCQQLPTSFPDPKDCIVFSVVGEPAEDPLGLDSCEDIGYAYLYLGDVVKNSGGAEHYTSVVAVRGAARGARGAPCGALAVRVHGVGLLRRCALLSCPDGSSHRKWSVCLNSSPLFVALILGGIFFPLSVLIPFYACAMWGCSISMC